MKHQLVVILVAVFISIGVAHAGPINGSFENGKVGWTASNDALFNTVISHTAEDGSPFTFKEMYPEDGAKFGLLTSAFPDSTLTSDLFDVLVGDFISLRWFFDARDVFPWNDFVSLAIISSAGSVLSEESLSSVETSGNWTLDGWNTFEYTSTLSGPIQLRITAGDGLDSSSPSYVGVDKVAVERRVNTPIPLPGTILLVMTAFAGLVSRIFLAKKDPIRA